MELKRIEVKRIAPRELPALLCFELNHLYYTQLSGFVVIYDTNEQMLYINECVPRVDVQKFVEYASFAGPYINMDESDGGLGSLGDYIYKKYGESAWKCLIDAYYSRKKTMKIIHAQKQAEKIIPLVKKINTSKKSDVLFDEFLVNCISKFGIKEHRETPYNMVGYDTKYVFWLGYLIGSGKVNMDENG